MSMVKTFETMRVENFHPSTGCKEKPNEFRSDFQNTYKFFIGHQNNIAPYSADAK